MSRQTHSGLATVRAGHPPSPESAASASVGVVRLASGERESRTDLVATESPLELRVHGVAVATVMRTPGNDEELAVGFLWSEGIANPADVAKVQVGDAVVEGVVGANFVDVSLKPTARVNVAAMRRQSFVSSSCGVCGKATIEAVMSRLRPLPATGLPALNAHDVQRMPEVMRRAQAGFSDTGGLHAAALFDGTGRMLCAREDVGRHNAVDKILGWMIQNEPVDPVAVTVSGRVSFEIVQKAAAGRIPVIVAVSAPTSLAVDMAIAAGVTIAGFVRGGRMNVYSHTERIVSARHSDA